MRRIEGRNPVFEALKAETKVKRLVLQKGQKGGIIDEITGLAYEQGLHPEYLPKDEITKMADSSVHQGVIAYAEEFQYVHPEDILDYAREKGETPLIILLDEIQDPYNLGSIIRTANAAGAHGIVIPKHRAVEITPVVTKASAGAVEYTKVAQVTNIARTIDDLKEAGLWIAGGALDTDQVIYQTDLKGPLGIVIGSEGTGLRRLVREKCDFIVQIPMYGQMESLNASVAAGIMIFEVMRQRNY